MKNCLDLAIWQEYGVYYDFLMNVMQKLPPMHNKYVFMVKPCTQINSILPDQIAEVVNTTKELVFIREIPNKWSFEPDLDSFRMSSDGKPTSHTHADTQARPSRQCQTPKRLEDHILDIHP